MTPLQQLEEKIYASNPELKKLGVGCEVMIDGKVYTVDDKFVSIQDNNELNTIMGYYFDWEYTIIGKPPTLVDVRNWILTHPNRRYLTLMKVFADWNDSIYLRDQDEALINFLNNLDNGL